MLVKWRDTARQALDEVLSYGMDCFGVHAAKRLLRDIYEYEKLLADNPRMGCLEPALADLPDGYRSVVVHSHYKLIYRVDEVLERVIILALWDTRRDPGQLKNVLMAAADF